MIIWTRCSTHKGEPVEDCSHCHTAIDINVRQESALRIPGGRELSQALIKMRGRNFR